MSRTGTNSRPRPIGRRLGAIALALTIGSSLPAAGEPAMPPADLGGAAMVPVAAQNDAPAEMATIPTEIEQRLRDRRAAVRRAAYDELVALGPAVAPALVACLAGTETTAGDYRVRLAAVEALAAIDPNRAVEPLVACLDDPADPVRAAAQRLLVTLPIENRVERLDAIYQDAIGAAGDASDDPEVLPIVPLGLDQLVDVLAMRRILEAFDRWRTEQNPRGIRIPNQYAALMAEHPEWTDVLVRFLRDPALDSAAMPEGWTMVDAELEAVRALADAERGDREVLTAILATQSRNVQGYFWPNVSQLTTLRGPSQDAVALACAIALYRLGGDDRIGRSIEGYENAQVRFPDPFRAWMLALTRIELGQPIATERNLRELMARERSIPFLMSIRTGPAPDVAVLYVHLARLILQRILDPTLEETEPRPVVATTSGEEADPLPPLPEATRDAALDALKRGLEYGFRDVAWLRADPVFAELESEPRYRAWMDMLDRLHGSASEGTAE